LFSKRETRLEEVAWVPLHVSRSMSWRGRGREKERGAKSTFCFVFLSSASDDDDAARPLLLLGPTTPPTTSDEAPAFKEGIDGSGRLLTQTRIDDFSSSLS
jgi:hypothetical protein